MSRAQHLPNLLWPLLPEHLGMLAVAFNVADAPARPALAASLLLRNFDSHYQEEVIDSVYRRILAADPRLVSLHQGPDACLQPTGAAGLALRCTQFVSAHWERRCQVDDGRLERTYPAHCFTLAHGRLDGNIIFLKCADCGAVYGGPWCWTTGSEKKTFPEGCHYVRGAASLQRLDGARWFFAVPQVCFETALLKFVLLLAARAGVSWTAFFTVYSTLFGNTFAGIKYALRPHFVTALEMAVTLWGSMRLIAQARTQSLWSCSFCLQPHHVAANFKPLLAAVKLAFSQLAAQHCCTLMSAMPLVVVDGKWCLQVSLCNDRFSSQTWNKDLQAGFFSGCVARPARGSKYCAEHSRTSSSKSEETSTQCIVGHRERAANGALRVEFKLADGAWVPSSAVSAGDVRRYELEKLPRCKPVSETCSQDPLRGTPEPLVSRKSGGVLVAVGPCLRILGIEPMFSSESLTQVVFFVWSMLAALRRLEWVIYDFACGVTEFLANQCRIRPDL
ncbi:unnamed protein product, partial [Effrenium voratum]